MLAIHRTNGILLSAYELCMEVETVGTYRCPTSECSSKHSIKVGSVLGNGKE